MQAIHSVAALPIAIVVLAIGIWGAVRAIQRQPLAGVFVTLTTLLQIIVIAQTLIGGYLWLAEGRVPLGGVAHIALGVVAALLLGGVSAWLRRDRSPRAQAIMAVAVITLAVVTFVSYVTG
jgi:hypothetical protein